MRDLLLNFIEKVGSKKEFKLYLNLITKIPRMQFGVIKISGATLDNHLDLIAKDIAFLNRVHIYPIVLHGAGAELDRRLPDSEKKDGMRITKQEDLAVIKEVFDEISRSLIEKIRHYGGSAGPVENLFSCERLSEYGYVGKIRDVDISRIEEVLNLNQTPIIHPLGSSPESYLNVNADTAAKEVIKRVNPQKVIILTETGGILDENGEIISFLNPDTLDYSNITGGMLLKVKEIIEILESNSDSAVVITSAEHMLKEIFTVKGSGTYIKSFTIQSACDVHTLDKERIKILLEDAFNKELVEDYFSKAIKELIYEKNYEGIAIIREINQIPYLDKFAVAKHRQETGLGGCLWDEIFKRHKKLIWRVTPINPLNAFYAKQCTGCLKYDTWNIYWVNLEQHEIWPTVEEVLRLPRTVV